MERNVSALRALTELPIVVGFGVKDGSSAKKMSRVSDGVIVGTALVKCIARLSTQNKIDKGDIEKCTAIIALIREALDSYNTPNSNFKEHE